MKQRYFIDNLCVITLKDDSNFSTKLICECFILGKKSIYYKDIFTNQEIDINNDNIINIEPFDIYYSPFVLKLTKKDLFYAYNDMNRIETLLNSTDEIIEETLEDRGIFEESKVYKKRYSN